MANKLKIFEKLGLIEKKEKDDDVIGNSALTETEGSDYSKINEDSKELVLESDVFEEIVQNAADHSDFQTPMSSVNPVLQGAYDAVLAQKSTSSTDESPKSDLMADPQRYINASIAPVNIPKEPTKEEVEKKLDAMIESYERNKLLSIEDIYRKNTLIQDIKSTVFMVDVYSKALPENLPLDIKRESVLNIMKASEIRIDDLLSDAYKRIDALNNVLESVVQATEELKVKNAGTIRDLEKRIEELKRTTQEREKFQETQNTMIEYEIQRIINIVDFVKPK